MGQKALAAAFLLASVVSFAALRVGQESDAEDDGWLSWSAAEAQKIAEGTFEKGRAGGIFDTRVLKTERAYNYKLAATWFTPEVIRATARVAQLREGLSVERARALVAEAEAAGDTVILVEIDPREGSGVIPRDWVGFLQTKGAEPGGAASSVGIERPELRNVWALVGVRRRNYDYDRFWLVFPLVSSNGEPLFPPSAQEAELVVRIYEKHGRVTWRIPDSIRRRAATRLSP